MNGVRTSCVYARDGESGIDVYLNFSILDFGEGFEAPTFSTTVEFVLEYKKRAIYHNSRKILVDTWKNVKSVVLTEFIDDVYIRMGMDMISRDRLNEIVDNIFKNDNSYTTPLMRAAEEGGFHTVH